MYLILRNFLIVAVMMFSGSALLGQAGTIRGKVTNGVSGEPMLGATVRIIQEAAVKGGAYTDLEGNYEIKTQPGTYTLIISYISFVSDTVAVTVDANQVQVVNSLMLEETAANEELTVEITAKRNEASEITLYNVKRNSINALDGVAFDLIQRTGDNNAAGAVTRIVGVTVNEGKYVYVRGLGDRYSKTTLNGAEIPGLDPNQNAVQMDLFPANLIDNIVVYKNFTPDLPGSFTGGLVDVRTKDFPDRFSLNFSATTSYNPQANLIDDFTALPEKGKTDWIGRDDGTRALPDFIQDLIDSGVGIPTTAANTDSAANYRLDAIAKSFNTKLDPTTRRSGLDQNYQLSIGNQFNLFGNPFGFVASISYRNEFTAYDATLGRYKNGSDAASGQILNSLDPLVNLSGPTGQQEVLAGGLIKLSYKLKNHKISFNYIRNQSGASTARYMDGVFQRDGGGRYLEARVLGYMERGMDVYQLQGSHVIGKSKLKWISSNTNSFQNEPDLRFFSAVYELADPNDANSERLYQPNSSSVTLPTHFFRTLNEVNSDNKLDWEFPFRMSGRESKIKFGGAYTYKDREFTEGQYFYFSNSGVTPFTGNVDAFFGDANLGVVGTRVTGGQTRYILGNTIRQLFPDRNQYDGTLNVIGAYLMTELALSNRLKAVGGLRYEYADALIVSKDANVAPGGLNDHDFLPVLNFIFAQKDNMNIRAGYARTLARPTFREFAPFESFDFAGDFTLIGNPDLQRTLIDNVDARWEWFFTPSEIISFSAFYKHFENPIERVNDPTVDNPRFIFMNNTDANTYGVELEFKKNFAFVNSRLENLTFGGNVSLIRSSITINEQEYEEIISVDPERSQQRPMFGQSPYAANAELAYVDKDKTGLQLSLNYNVFGPRIAVVGGKSPDVYEKPRSLMNLSIGKDLGEHVSIRLRANNLLNPAYRMTYEYKGVEYDFQNYKIGRSFSIGLTVKI
jgi:hypothetical protein